MDFEFVNSVFYDPMYLLFEGIARTMIQIFFGLHENVSGTTALVVSDTNLNDVNGSLEQCKT